MEKWNLLIGPQLYLQTYVWDCWMKVKEKEREAHTHTYTHCWMHGDSNNSTQNSLLPLTRLHSKP